jgi:hypothetical protein
MKLQKDEPFRLLSALEGSFEEALAADGFLGRSSTISKVGMIYQEIIVQVSQVKWLLRNELDWDIGLEKITAAVEILAVKGRRITPLRP